MSVDVYSWAIIGCKINKKDIYKTVEAYEHQYPSDFEFDPKNGNRLWKITDKLKDYLVMDVDYGLPLFDKYLCVPLDIDYQDTYVVAETCVRTVHELYKVGFQSLIPPDNTHDKYVTTLSDKGLWNPKTYGLYSIIYKE